MRPSYPYNVGINGPQIGKVAYLLFTWCMIGLLYPLVAEGQTNCATLYSALSINGSQQKAIASVPPSVVAGSVEMNLKFETGNNFVTSIAGVSLRYTLDDQPIGPVLTDGFAWSWDTTSASDGTHVLSVLYVNEPQPTGKPCYQFSGREYSVVVENSGSPRTGMQLLPVTGASEVSWGVVLPQVADWVLFPGSQPHATAHPYNYQFIPPAGGVAVTKGWYSEPLVANVSHFAEVTPAFYSLWNGSFVTESFSTQHGDFDETSYPYVAVQGGYDGPRDDNSISPYATLVPDLDGPGFLGISIDGRLFKLNMDGSVQTLVGWVTRRDVVPFYYLDLSIPNATRQSEKEILLGSFDIQFRDPLDLAIDPNDHNLIYVADNLNQRIAKVDLSVSPPVVTTFAGTPGHAGYQNGPASSALFNGPSSLVIEPNGVMYVADQNNSVIREIDTSGNVTTLVGIGYPGSPTPEPTMKVIAASPLSYAPRSPVSFNTSYINYPLVIRLDSKGNIVLGEPVTGTIRYIDLTADTVTTLAQLGTTGSSVGSWIWLDVDRWGNVGAVDDILVDESVGGGDNSSVYRIPIGGTMQVPPPNAFEEGISSPLHNGLTCCIQDAAGEYPWAIAIDDQEGRWIAMGFGSFGVGSFHIVQPTDPAWQLDRPKFSAGKQVWNTGTVPGFPLGSRPGFAAVHGYQGHSLLGSVQNFDDMTSMTDAQLATYIQNGAEGSVPRPEITGNDLRNVIYFIRRSALGGDLAQPGPSSLDTTPPVISNVVAGQTASTTANITWQTNKTTLGFVAWGTSTSTYFGWSPLETSYGTTHTVTLSNLPASQTIHFVVRSKDLAGNQSVTADQIIVLQ